MSDVNVSQTESSAPAATTSSPASSTPQGASSTGATASSSGVSTTASGGDSSAEIAQSFSPDYKFKVMDKEHEIDEMFRPLIKDTETEKKIKELFTKAYGFDHAKPKHEKTLAEHMALQEQHTSLNENINYLSQLVRDGDFGNYFESLNIPKEAIFKWVLDEIQLAEKPPEEQQRYQQQNLMKRDYLYQQQQMKRINEQYQSTQSKLRNVELQTALSQPEVRSVAQAYDTRVGRPGAFRELVVQQGILAYHTQKKDLTAEEAVQAASAIVGNVEAASPTLQPQVVAQSTPPPIIPNVSGRGGSPARRQPRSLEDLKKMAREM